MSDTRSRFDRTDVPDPGPVPETLDHDLAALRGLTAEGRPDLETSLRAARSRAGGKEEEGFTMAVHFLRRRPALATVLGVVVVALGLLAIPISYQRTVGYDVALTLHGANLAQSQVRDMAAGFKQTLGSGDAAVMASMENGRLTYVFKATGKGDARGAAQAFAKELTVLGYQVSVSATPVKETVSGNVYAYAMNQVIEIRTDGKSAAELESEIRSRLLAAGVTKAQVSVTDLGGDQRSIKVEAQHTMEGGAPLVEVPELVLTKDGKPLTGGSSIELRKKKDAAGLISLAVTIRSDGRTLNEEIPNAGSMSDAQLSAEIQSRLDAAGFDLVVGVGGDQITVEKRKK
jgi:hypothetical protein